MSNKIWSKLLELKLSNGYQNVRFLISRGVKESDCSKAYLLFHFLNFLGDNTTKIGITLTSADFKYFFGVVMFINEGKEFYYEQKTENIKFSVDNAHFIFYSKIKKRFYFIDQNLSIDRNLDIIQFIAFNQSLYSQDEEKFALDILHIITKHMNSYYYYKYLDPPLLILVSNLLPNSSIFPQMLCQNL